MHLSSIGEGLTAALTTFGGAPALGGTPHRHELAAGLRHVASGPLATALSNEVSPLKNSPFDWSHPPSTRAHVFAQRLAGVQPVCVVGSRRDRENCLLDLPPDVPMDVDVSRLMLAGCEASLPAELRTALAADGLDAAALRRSFMQTFATESKGQFSVAALEHRLTKRLRQMAPGMLRVLAQTNAYIEVPEMTFLRVITSPQEARRHAIFAPFSNPDLRLPTGEISTRPAMLGAYIRIPTHGTPLTLFVSLNTPATITPLQDDPRTHARENPAMMFGDIPDYLEASYGGMVKVPIGENLVQTLAQWLHDGHQRYKEFAYGGNREALTPISHARIRQPLCEPSAPTQTPTSVAPPPSTADHASASSSQPTETTDAPRASEPPPVVRTARKADQRRHSLAELQAAVDVMERLDRRYSFQSRPRFG